MHKPGNQERSISRYGAADTDGRRTRRPADSAYTTRHIVAESITLKRMGGAEGDEGEEGEEEQWYTLGLGKNLGIYLYRVPLATPRRIGGGADLRPHAPLGGTDEPMPDPPRVDGTNGKALGGEDESEEGDDAGTGLAEAGAGGVGIRTDTGKEAAHAGEPSRIVHTRRIDTVDPSVSGRFAFYASATEIKGCEHVHFVGPDEAEGLPPLLAVECPMVAHDFLVMAGAPSRPTSLVDEVESVRADVENCFTYVENVDRAAKESASRTEESLQYLGSDTASELAALRQEMASLRGRLAALEAEVDGLRKTSHVSEEEGQAMDDAAMAASTTLPVLGEHEDNPDGRWAWRVAEEGDPGASTISLEFGDLVVGSWTGRAAERTRPVSPPGHETAGLSEHPPMDPDPDASPLRQGCQQPREGPSDLGAPGSEPVDPREESVGSGGVDTYPDPDVVTRDGPGALDEEGSVTAEIDPSPDGGVTQSPRDILGEGSNGDGDGGGGGGGPVEASATETEPAGDAGATVPPSEGMKEDADASVSVGEPDSGNATPESSVGGEEDKRASEGGHAGSPSPTPRQEPDAVVRRRPTGAASATLTTATVTSRATPGGRPKRASGSGAGAGGAKPKAVAGRGGGSGRRRSAPKTSGGTAAISGSAGSSEEDP